jgi:predicted MFS family arabinose efflux permease
VRALLRRGGFRTLLVGQGVSALGDWMGTVALMALVLQLTDSSTAVAGILVLRLAPAAVAGPLAARIAFRTDRRSTMLVTDLVRAGMVALVPLVAGVWWVYLWAFLLEVASIVFLPARDASIPDLVAVDDLDAANALVLGSSYGCIPLGAGAFALVAVLSQGLGGRLAFAPVFWIDAATFVFSYFMIRRLSLPGRAERAEDSERAGGTGSGFAAAFRIRLVRAVLVPAAAAAVGIGVLFSTGIVFVRDTLGASNAEFAVLIALFGVGAGLGVVLLQRSEGSDLGAVHLAVAIQGVTIGVMSLAPEVLIAYLGAVMFGAAASAALTAGMTVVQRELDGRERVLAFTAFHVVIRTGLSLAAVGAGVATDLLGAVSWPVLGALPPTRLVLLGAGAVVLCAALALAPLRREEGWAPGAG